MGIKDLLPLVSKACTQCSVGRAVGPRGARVAVDVACWLHRALTGCAQQLLVGDHTDFYVQYCLRYVQLLLRHNCHVVLVFDGRSLPAKQATDRSRGQRREEMRKRALQLLAAGDSAAARDAARQAAPVTWHMKKALMQACAALRPRCKVDCIVAPHEADAQLAYLSNSGLADLVVTEDSDLILYGVHKILFKLDSGGGCLLYDRGQLHLCALFPASSSAPCDHEQVQDEQQAPNADTLVKLRRSCILSGCDYLPQGLPGVGLAKATKFFSKCSQDDMTIALPRLPRYLNMPSLKVSRDFVNDFMTAEQVFLHQIIFCPKLKKRMPLTEFTQDSPYDARCGDLHVENALEFACGLIDPNESSSGRLAQSGKPHCITEAPAWSIWSQGSPPKKAMDTELARSQVHSAFSYAAKNVTARSPLRARDCPQSVCIAHRWPFICGWNVEMDESECSSDASSSRHSALSAKPRDRTESRSSSGGDAHSPERSGRHRDASADDPPPPPEDVRRDCETKFAQPDYVLEPELCDTLLQYTTAGGDPDAAVPLLAANYHAMPQMCNLLGEWLLPFETAPEAVQDLFEGTVCQLALQHFQPHIADRLLSQANIDAEMAWLPELIQQRRWRDMIYKLTELYPDCMMLNFAIKLCSDSGFQHEICNVHTAAQQLEIFSGVLISSIKSVLHASTRTHTWRTTAFSAALSELARVAGHTEATYAYALALLRFAARLEGARHDQAPVPQPGECRVNVKCNAKVRDCLQGANGVPAALCFLAQELRSLVPRDTTALTLAVLNTRGTSADNPDASDDAPVYPHALLSALESMLHKRALNPADATLLHEAYVCTGERGPAPALELLREPAFVQLLVDCLFRPRPAVTLSQERRNIYISLLSAASVLWPRSLLQEGGPRWNRDDLPATEAAIASMSDLCQGRRHGGAGGGETFSSELVAELGDVLAAIRSQPAVAWGLLHFVSVTLHEPDYFHRHPDSVPVHFAILDEIAQAHPLMHHKQLELLTGLLRRVAANAECALGERLLQRQRMLVDRLVHLAAHGCALEVTQWLRHTYDQGDVDTSLIRYFTMEVLDIISPPYSAEFAAVFLPLVSSPEIMDARTIKEGGALKQAPVTHPGNAL